MRVLIVDNGQDRARIWMRHLERQGHTVHLVTSQSDAITQIQACDPDIIVLNLVLDDGSALAVSDFASYRVPDTRVIFVTNTTFFSDGSLFAVASNACAHIQAETPAEDLTAIVEYYAASA